MDVREEEQINDAAGNTVFVRVTIVRGTVPHRWFEEWGKQILSEGKEGERRDKERE